MLKKLALTVLTLALVTLLIIAYRASLMAPPSSQAFINANILTMDDDNSTAEALLIEDSRIIAVGTSKEIQRKITADTIIHDLKGKTLIPGFIDAHGHFPGSGLAALSTDLNSPPIGNITTIEQLINALKQTASKTPKGEWILGIGYDDTLLAEKRHPNRLELDEAIPDHPVFLWHISGHMGVANSAALAIADVDESTPNPEGGIYVKDPDSGKLNGLLEENAAMAIQTLAMDFSALDFLTMAKNANEEYARQGVTTAQSGAVDIQMSQGLKLASQLGIIDLRLELWPLFDQLGLQLLDGSIDSNSLETETVNLGAIKIIADGSIQGYTGYLSKPYHTPFHGDENYRGYPRVIKQELIDTIEKYHAAGYQIATHGNGDASIDDILDAIELALQKHPNTDSRHIIVHAQMAREDQLDRMKALGVTPTFFVAHTYYWGDRHRDIFMGPERAAGMSPTASAETKRLPYTIHLDTPVVPMNPLLLVWTAVNRLSSSGQVIGEQQRIDPLNALRAVTIDAAWQIFQEDNRGSIEAGKYADIVVLDANPISRPETIKDININLTMVGGRTLFSNLE